VLSAVLNTIRYLLNKVRGWTTTLRTWIDKVVAGKATVGEKLQEMKNKIRSLDTLDLMESRNVDVLSQRIRGVFELKKLEAHVNLQKTADAARIRASFGVELALNGITRHTTSAWISSCQTPWLRLSSRRWLKRWRMRFSRKASRRPSMH